MTEQDLRKAFESMFPELWDMHLPSLHHLHLSHLKDWPHKLLHTELGELYLNIALRQFANSLIAVFIPLYLLSLDFTFSQVICFYAVFFGVISLLAPVATIVGGLVGLKHVILYRTPVTIAYLVALQIFLPKNPGLLYWIAGLSGIAAIFYWMPMHSLFARASHDKKRGREVGMFQSLLHLSALVAPALGGIIIVLLGYSVLFTITIVLIALSVIPLFFTPDIQPTVDFSFKRMFSRRHFNFTARFAAEGVTSGMATVLWPLFIFATIKSTMSVGFVASITEVGIVVFTLYIGRLSDTMRKENLLHLGGLLLGATWFVRYLADTAMKIFAIGALDGFVRVMVNVPLRTLLYEQAMKEQPDEFILFREICLSVGRVVSLAALLLFADKYLAGFIMAGLASLVFAVF